MACEAEAAPLPEEILMRTGSAYRRNLSFFPRFNASGKQSWRCGHPRNASFFRYSDIQEINQLSFVGKPLAFPYGEGGSPKG
ncbi:MAG: hypothetical protein MR763_12655 [Clostridiales bacterium]|nr:hypothetical protein [Clostridiales bacterium]